MSQPEEIAKADPLDADPSLAGAPLNVRKASAWLAKNASRKLRNFALAPLATFLSGLAGASVAHDVLGLTNGTPEVIFFVMGLATVGMIFGGAYYTRPYGYAVTLVERYRQLQAARPADEVGAEPAATPLDRMVARIESLAGTERPEVAAAARKAAEHARRLQAELAHIARMATGQPEADAALDGARSSLEADLARTQARVAELYASLVDLQAGGPVDELRLATERISAELEVDAKLASARRATTRQRA